MNKDKRVSNGNYLWISYFYSYLATRAALGICAQDDRVVLTAPIPDEGLETGDVGAVVHVCSGAAAFDVEFVTLGGNTAAVVTVAVEKVRPVTKTEIP